MTIEFRIIRSFRVPRIASARNDGDVEMTDFPPTLGLVLAGGLARRMGGGDKALIAIGGTTILERVLARLAPQCNGIILNANGDPARFAFTGLPVVADECRISPDRWPACSPASTGRRRTRPSIAWVVSVPGDCPFLPADLVARLHAGARGEAARRSPAPDRATGGIPSSACGRSRCATDLRHALVGRGPAQDRGLDRAATASPSPNGRPSRSIPSSTSTRREDAAEADAHRRTAALPMPLTACDRLISPGVRRFESQRRFSMNGSAS